jgi:phosphatidylserine/phosphatidylglycerophosphate/cardiolipin synthase-like enzyme
VASAFNQVSKTALVSLTDGLEGGRLTAPYTVIGLRQCLPETECLAICDDLNKLKDLGLQPKQIAVMLRIVIAEREAAHRTADQVELVWTGPDTDGVHSRDTGVVVRELFAQAHKSVLVSGFAIFQGKQVFKTLADRMDSRPELSVRMFLNVARAHLDDTSDAELLRRFAESFLCGQWPGQRIPQVFYDPRSLVRGGGPKASLHAKCIVIDDDRALITSANLTEAAQERNIEAGILIRDPIFAKSLRDQFETLVSNAVLKRVPGIS